MIELPESYVLAEQVDQTLIGTPIRYHAAGERRPDKHQLLIEFEDSSWVPSPATS